MGVLASAAVLSGVLAVTVDHSPAPPDPDEALARAGKLVASAGWVRFSGLIEGNYVMGEPDGPGFTQSGRAEVTGRWAGEARWQGVVDWGEYADEQLRHDDDVFSRSADTTGGLDDALWFRVDAVDEGDLRDVAEWMIGPLDGGTLNDFELPGALLAIGPMAIDPILAPSGLADLLQRAEDPDLARGNDEEPDVLSFTVTASDEADRLAFGRLPTPHVEVELSTSGLPVRLQVEAEDDGFTYAADLEFDWLNWPAAVQRPRSREIEETPWLDEAALEEARELVEGLRPKKLPDDFELVYLEAYGFGDCPEINYTYGSDGGYGDDYLDIYLVPADCALDYDSTPFLPGPFGTVPAREGELGWEVRIRDTVVQFDTSVDDDALAELIGSLAPFDLDAAVAAYNERMTDEWGG